MTRKAKIAVTIDPDRLEAARRAVAHGRATSVSAYVENALLRYERLSQLDADIEETLARTGGPITDEERAWADQALGL